MKRMKNYLAGLCAVALGLIVLSCDNNNDIITTNPDTDFDVVLNVDEAGPLNPNKDVTVNANAQSDIKAKVSFISTTSMKRLYITRNIKGQGDEKFTPDENIDFKGDGSVDLAGKSDKAFDFSFVLPVPPGVGDGTVVYTFWVTTGTGDFRDPSKREVGAGTLGTITLKYGTAANPDALLKFYGNRKLVPPLADGSSNTFISLLDGNVYKINEGQEKAAYWDFGYINLQNGGPTLHSTSSYTPEVIPSLDNIIERNTTHFRLSDMIPAEFDAANEASDLDFDEPTDTYISYLEATDVIEFVDQYGKKGLIKVLEVQPGNGSDKFIRFDIKVQP